LTFHVLREIVRSLSTLISHEPGQFLQIAAP
jgi:hypothetical protein